MGIERALGNQEDPSDVCPAEAFNEELKDFQLAWRQALFADKHAADGRAQTVRWDGEATRRRCKRHPGSWTWLPSGGHGGVPITLGTGYPLT